ncbi:translation initiation factor IF-2-like [Pyrus x bretschneideri]|uniref:translation initiation factor IF-2-like n=1 Tax=Pyrus x bretschneideri TaxID=225117 RepID=UPI002030D7D3|nr:translation initiation factor IF-2-like [Pyrus x bretschneideri]
MEHSPKFKPLLSQSSSRRRRTSTDSNSPEFEFWRNPSFPQPNLLSADELFVDGVLLPLHLLPPPLPNNSDPPDPYPRSSDPNTQPISLPPVPDPERLLEPDPESEPGPGPELSAAPVTASKRWRDIFKKGEKKSVKGDEIDKDKDKKKERKGGRSGASSAELNINIWPFSRSRSAGNAYTRPKPFGAQGTRKVNSAPCSRSNSTGDSKSRKWPPASPGRPGVHLGRSSPVWQVRRGASAAAKRNSEPQARNAEKGTKQEVPEIRRSKKTARSVVAGGSGSKARVLNLNVPMCIGYRSHLSCRSENSAVGVGVGGGSSSINLRGGVSGGVNGGGGNGIGGSGGAGGNLFNLRSLFTKKVY